MNELSDELRATKNWLKVFAHEYNLPAEAVDTLHAKFDGLGDLLARLQCVPQPRRPLMPRVAPTRMPKKPAPKPRPKKPRPSGGGRRGGKEHARVVLVVDMAGDHGKKEQITLTEGGGTRGA
jgi:hypothetical protein